MSPRIMCHNHTISDSEKDLITRKVERLRKYFDRITEVSVILDATKRSALAEILTIGPQTNLMFKHEAENMRTAFEGAVNKAERGLREFKTRKWGDKKHKRNSVTIRRFNPMDFDFATDFRTTESDTVSFPGLETLESQALSLEEAHRQMEAQQSDILVFINSATDNLTILHRKAHDNVEIVELDGHEIPSDVAVEIQMGHLENDARG